MPEQRTSPTSCPALIGGDAIGARVVLVGRTGQDARLRLDPAVELIRVRTGFDAIGELANPVGEVPGRTVVIVGSGSDIDERNGGDGAFVSAARRVAPDAIVLRVGDIGANSSIADAYDGVVPPSASSDELRELVHGPTPSVDEPDEPVAPEPPAHVPPASTNGTLIHADPDPEPAASQDQPDIGLATEPDDEPDPPHTHGVAPMNVTHHGVGPEDGLDEEELALLREPEPMLAPVEVEAGDRPGEGVHAPSPPARSEPPSADAEVKPMEPSRFGGDGDDVLVAAALGGRDILEPALGLIRARVGRSDVEFVPHADGDDPDAVGGVAVVWSGTRYGTLRIAGIDAGMIATGNDDASGRLAHHARWLGTWLALAEQHRRLRLEAFTDPVSGAWNRRYFDRFLEAALPHARQRRYKLTVLVFDLDNFKSFNDRFGHQAGDMILSETVRLLRTMTRPTDRICRIGGDEFAVVFYEPDGPRDTHSD
ncbi:MAG: diguanylate cyclase, partial [Planctomycetota bacterium]